MLCMSSDFHETQIPNRSRTPKENNLGRQVIIIFFHCEHDFINVMSNCERFYANNKQLKFYLFYPKEVLYLVLNN